MPQDPTFSKLRAALWPIQNNELKKFLPMSLMMFFVLFNYTLLRNIKDTLIITAPACGAEVIPFVKLFGGMPAALLFFFIYLKLSNILSRKNLFYTCLIPFLIFFTAFAFIIFPNKEILHPTLQSIEGLRETCPNAKWFLSLYGVWSYAIFYIFSELWGVVVLAVLFWQFANEITRTSEAKRFYPFFGLLANLSLIASGTLVQWFLMEDWATTITYMMMAVVITGVCILFTYWWINRYVLVDPFYYDAADSIRQKKKEDKPKLSLKDSLHYIFSSKYLGFIAVLVFSFGISMNFIDITWKSQIKEYYPSTRDYMGFMGAFSTWTGIGTILLTLSTKGIVRRFGWLTGAIITPLMVLITSALFFTFIFFKDSLDSQMVFFGVTSVYMAVMIGAVQNMLSKGTKYSLFDSTMEMAYIPLDQELKVKGKTAVDVIAGRLGKSGGGLLQVILLTLTAGSQLSIAPYLFILTIMVSFAWLGAARSLSTLYNAKVGERGK
ncbi:MAG: NTP/NDP exchange transporter [Alphaproteobacteria bacterium]|nr:NTP/NDP exchange transporter [Alphaproteobacteria bacterium]